MHSVYCIWNFLGEKYLSWEGGKIPLFLPIFFPLWKGTKGAYLGSPHVSVYIWHRASTELINKHYLWHKRPPGHIYIIPVFTPKHIVPLFTVITWKQILRLLSFVVSGRISVENWQYKPFPIGENPHTHL